MAANRPTLVTKIVVRSIVFVCEKVIYLVTIIMLLIFWRFIFERIPSSLIKQSQKRILARMRIIFLREVTMIFILYQIMLGIVIRVMVIFKFDPRIQILAFVMVVGNFFFIENMSRRLIISINNNTRLIKRVQMIFKLIFNPFFLMYLVNSFVQMRMEIDFLGNWYFDLIREFWVILVKDLVVWLVFFSFFGKLIHLWGKNEWAVFESFHLGEVVIQICAGSLNTRILLLVVLGFYKSWEFFLLFFHTYGVRMVADFRTWGRFWLPKRSCLFILFGSAQFFISFAGLLLFWRGGCNIINKKTGMISLIPFTGYPILKIPIKEIRLILIKKTQDGDLMYLQTREYGTFALTPVNSGGNLVQKGENLARFLKIELKVID